MATIRWTLIAVLFIAWTLPATGLAQPGSPTGSSVPAQPVPARVEGKVPRAPDATPAGGEAAGYAAREQQSRGLENYQGGALVIYIGGGAVLVALFILLLLLV
jgi:hypothetical protein